MGCARSPDVAILFGHDTVSVCSADMPRAADPTSAFGYRGPDSAELIGQSQTIQAIMVGRMHGCHSGAPHLVASKGPGSGALILRAYKGCMKAHIASQEHVLHIGAGHVWSGNRRGLP